MENLDAMSIDQLLKMNYHINMHPRIEAKRMGLSVADTKLYSKYAINKAVAMEQRLDGNINIAMKYESICDNIYNQMSQDAKW